MSTKKEEKKGFGHFVSHQGDNGETLYFGGRTAGAWGKTLLFYGVFYGMLSAFWISCFTGMQSYLPSYEDGPELQDIIRDTESLFLQTYPGRFGNSKDLVTYPGGVRDEDPKNVFPAGDDDAGLPIDPMTNTVFKLNTWLTEFTDQGLSPGQLENIKGFCGGENYGYDSTTPCFFLKLNRIRGRLLRGVNETVDACETDGASDLEKDAEWGDSDEAKVMKARECKKSGASFLPIACTEYSTGNGLREATKTEFEVRSFLTGDDETGVKGLAFVPFLNSIESFGYRDPIVAVRAKVTPTKDESGSEDTIRPYDQIECKVSLSEDSESKMKLDEDTGEPKVQRVVNTIGYLTQDAPPKTWTPQGRK